MRQEGEVTTLHYCSLRSLRWIALSTRSCDLRMRPLVETSGCAAKRKRGKEGRVIGLDSEVLARGSAGAITQPGVRKHPWNSAQ